MIKVLHVGLSDRTGGIERFILNFAKYVYFSNREIKISVISFGNNGYIKKELLKYDVRIIEKRKSVFDFEDIVKENYDFIHFHKNSVIDNSLIRYFHRKSKAQIILHSHNSSPSNHGWLRFIHFILRRHIYSITDYHLACSKKAGAWMFGHEHFELMPNGVDADDFIFSNNWRDLYRKKLDIPDDAIVVGNIGRLSRQKNQKYLIRVFESMLAKTDKFKLVLIGSGDLKDELVSYSKALHLDERIIFLDERPDINKIFSIFDLIVMPSLYEGLPIVALEAQSVGVLTYIDKNITSEIEVTDAIRWFDRKENPQVLAEYIVNDFESSYRKDTYQTFHNQFSKSIFCLKDASKKLLDFYYENERKK